MAQDAMFEKRGNCYEEWLFNYGVKQSCCYSKNGKLLTGYPGGGFPFFDGMEHSMDAIHDACCHGNKQSTCKAFYDINPSDDCSNRYEEPVSALSWGDPVIETVGSQSYNYSFNGHGEYVFLKSENGLEIQARLDYLVPDNNDSTIFTALVLTNYKKNDSIQIEFNRSNKSLSLYLNDGTLWNTTNICTRGPPTRTIGFMLTCLLKPSNGFHIIPDLTLNNIAFDISTDGEFINIKVSPRSELSNMTGLAGNVHEGSYISLNGTSYAAKNTSESGMFDYGESWALRNNSRFQSKFRYNLTGGMGGNSIYYNTYSQPRFFEDLLDNTTALFGKCNGSNITAFEETCRNSWDNQTNKDCMLTIARTCNMSLGKAIHAEVVSQRNDFLRKTNKPPTFRTTMPNETALIYKGNTSWILNLSAQVWDDNIAGLQFKVEPKLDEMTISGGIFNWTVGTALRASKNRTIQFIVYDQYNMSDDQLVNLYYCGCEEPIQCKFQTKDDDTAECNCTNRYWTGDFCEIQSYPCIEYHCYEPNKCNNSTYVGSPCAPCPDGWYDPTPGLQTQTCLDLNECNKTKTHGCEHVCNNLVGSYKCSCYAGFTLNADNHSCSDVDECASGTVSCPTSTETCMNLPGNYTCVCEAGYSKETPSAKCTPIVGTMYFGYIEYVLTAAPTQTNSTLQAGIQSASTIFTQKLTGTDYFSAIEIYKIFVTTTHFHLDFIVHTVQLYMNTTLDMIEVADNIEKALKQTDISLESTHLGQSAKVHIKSPEEGGLCDVIPKRTDCLEQSTHCVNRNISQDYYDCDCNVGYKKHISGKKRDIFCEDIDECQLFAKNNTTDERCVHGFMCVNTIGSWNCTCPPERLWMTVGTPEYPVYRCQGNHSYLGNITFIWNAKTEAINLLVIESFLNTHITDAFTNSTLDPESTSNSSIPITSLFVSVTILENTSLIKVAFVEMYMLTYEFRIRMGDPINTLRLQAVADAGFNDGRTVGPAEFKNMTIFNESENELCKRTKNSSCDLRTTICVQGNGTTSCKCKPGYHMHPGDSHSCQDVDECKADYPCLGGGTCVNMEGNWTCSCPSDTSLVVVNKTVHNCSAAAFNMCTSIEKKYSDFACPHGERICNDSMWSCSCHHGYTFNGTGIHSTCLDVNECLDNPCGNGKCTNNPGSYSCVCSKGFELNDTLETCIDIDECDTKATTCKNGICINYNGSYECRCKDGYYEQYHLPSVTICADINECTNASYSCGGNCTNLEGYFTCECPPGYVNYTEDAKQFKCTDFDECENQSDYRCIGGTCNNTIGSWDCVCGVNHRALKLNNTAIKCIEIFRYPMQFEVQEMQLPGSTNPTDKEIEDLLIKRLTDILNTSQAVGGTVHFPVDLLPDGYQHPSNGNITIKVTVILSTPSSNSVLQNVFEKSLADATLRTILTSTGNFLVISLDQKEIELNQCKLHTKECDFNTTKCVFDKATGHVSCECRTGYKDRKNYEGVEKCEPEKATKGDFAYVASITIQANISTNGSKLIEMVKVQITTMYQTMFPSNKIWVEIITKLDPSKQRRKRQASETTQASIQYIVHLDQSKNATEIENAWKNCTARNSYCYDKVKAVSNKTDIITYNENVTIEVHLDVCNISTMCAKNTTTCNDTANKTECICKAGYVNNTFINDTFSPFYTCDLPADAPDYSSLTTSTTSTTVTSTKLTSTTKTSATSTSIFGTDANGSIVTQPTAANNSYSIEPNHGLNPVSNGNTTTHQANTTASSSSPKNDTTTKAKEKLDVKTDDKANNTALIATGASLGSVVLILVITVIFVCRLRNKKAHDAERIKLKELEKDRRNGFDNSLLGRNYLNSDSKQNSTNQLRDSNRDNRRNPYYGGPFKPIEPNYTRPFKSVDSEPIWDRNGHAPGMNGRSGSLPDINGHVDMRMAPDTRKMSHRRDSDPLYSSPTKKPSPTQKPMENYRQNMVRVFPDPGERLPRTRNNNFSKNTGNGRRSPEPDYYDPPESPKPDYQKRSRDRLNESPDSGLNGYSSSGSPDVQRSRESYGSLGRGRFRMADTPF